MRDVTNTELTQADEVRENPYSSPLAPVSPAVKPPKAKAKWISPALIMVVIYASILIYVMLRTAYGR